MLLDFRFRGFPLVDFRVENVSGGLGMHIGIRLKFAGYEFDVPLDPWVNCSVKLVQCEVI